MYLLPRAIDGTIGKQLIFRLVTLLFEIAVTGKINILGWRKLIHRSGNQPHSIHIFEVSLTIVISCQSGMNDSLLLVRLVIIAPIIEYDFRIRYRLAIRCIYHYIAMLIIRQLLNHYCQIADIEEQSLRSDTGVVRSHLHQVST